MDVDYSLPANRVIRFLEQLMESYGKPACLRCDNGPEFISTALTEWCETKEIRLHWIQPGKPTQNAFIERFNGSFRRELGRRSGLKYVSICFVIYLGAGDSCRLDEGI